jgi:hypothetical protein
MANAVPVNSETKVEANKAAPQPKHDARRPMLDKEVSGKDKPKNTYKMGDTVVEDY